jgi:hypothetical protein
VTAIYPASGQKAVEAMTRKAVLSDDTTADAEDLQVRLWSEMTADEKSALITGLSQAAAAMAVAGIRQRHPSASEREIFCRYAILTLGAELACRAYPDAASFIEHL